MKRNNFPNIGLALFLMIAAVVLMAASIILYPVIVGASANLTRMIFRALGLN